jgi:putative NADPH-quinone reductase
MRALVVFAHPKTDSFSAAVLARVTDRLEAAGAEVRLRDLYRSNFSPVLTAHEFDIYLDEAANVAPVAQDVADLQWADTLIFVYPTWWYGLPAMLKGWLDRVLVPGVAFLMPRDGEDIRPGLTNIRKLAVFTTCGASFWLTTLIGSPGRRTLTRGVRAICAKGCKTYFAAHYLMDSSTPESRAKHLDRVGRTMDRICA